MKGRFGYDFPMHRDRLMTPVIRKGWMHDGERWVWTGEWPRHREGPWQTIEEMGARKKPRPPKRQRREAAADRRARTWSEDDVRDRVATPPGWHSAFREATWDEALSLAAQELKRIRDDHGPRALAALSSAKCSNEDNYVFMRMVRAGFGTNSVDHCTRLCHSTSVAAMSRALATSAASGSMREIEEACDVIFISGANTTETHPVFGALIKRAVSKGASLIVADVRRTELAELADIHLQMMPGTDVALYNGMLNHIIAAGLTDRKFIEGRTHDFEKVKDVGRRATPRRRAAKITGIPAATIRAAAEMYARGPRTSTLWAMGLTQHNTGTDIVASLLNLMLACGMIGKWGAAMLPIRGQNNVQGASDMGAIPFAYTDYRPVTDPANRAEYAKAWRVPEESLSLEHGLMVTEMVQDGSPIRGLYVMGENPVLSDPNISHAEHWVRGLEFLAVQDLFLTETARWADVVLPGSSFAEKSGTFVNTDRHIQLTEAALDPPGQARRDLDILIELSNRLGLPTDYRSPGDVMREIAQRDAVVARRELRDARAAALDSVSGAHSRLDRHAVPLPGRLPHRRTARPASCPSSSSSPTSCRARSSPSSSTPGARCTTGTRGRCRAGPKGSTPGSRPPSSRSTPATPSTSAWARATRCGSPPAAGPCSSASASPTGRRRGRSSCRCISGKPPPTC